MGQVSNSSIFCSGFTKPMFGLIIEVVSEDTSPGLLHSLTLHGTAVTNVASDAVDIETLFKYPS